MTWLIFAACASVWCVGAGALYGNPGIKDDRFVIVMLAVSWPLWCLPALLFSLGQWTRRALTKALAEKPATESHNPRTF